MSSYGEPRADDYEPYGHQYQAPQPDGGGYAADPGYGTGYDQSPGYDPGSGYDHSAGYDPNYYAPAPPAKPTSPASGRASVPPAASGRASVPGVSAGRASVPPPSAGRASVRPAALPDVAGGDGRPDGRSDGRSDRPRKGQTKKRRTARWQKLVIAGVGVFILLIGGGMIGGSYFYDKVLPPDQLSLKNSTEVFAANGTTQLAKLGTEHRSEVPMSVLDKKVRDALIAGEDKNFYNHHGVDLWGIARAAWNNLTGGETQGASTITQQYARQAANDLEVTYARKVREAVMARKLEDTYTKDQILGFYLNTVYFGRGAHGVGAAAEAYFGIKPENIKDLSVAQAAVLGAVLKQPEGKNGFDPHVSEQARKNSEDRWNYVLNNMIENSWLTAAEKAAYKYPWPQNVDAPAAGELIKPKENQGGATGYTDSGTGYVINYVAEELAEKGVVKYLNDNGMGNWKNAGLKITTTIEPAVQAALEAQLNRANPNATLSKERDNILGAGVSIDPRTGRVVAYYGGTNNGSGTDYAGDDQPHPPASSFKIYTLAAAIDKGISIKSRWDPTALKKSAGDDYDLGNANREGSDACGTWCTLEDMTVNSFNVPFFDIARKIQPRTIVQMAHKAGVNSMWTTDPFKEYDLSQPIQDRQPFDYWAGIGQYPVTVLDHASGTATIANHGMYFKPHFVVKVERKNKKTGEWERIPQGDEKAVGEQRIRAEVADEVVSVLKKIAPPQADGREAGGKTGTWENGAKSSPTKYVFPNTNAHVWFTGFTTQLATTFWVGSKDENKTPIKMNTGKSDLLKEANMASTYPKNLWKKFMDQVNKELKLPKEKLTNGTGGRIGDDSEGVGTGVSPTPQIDNCALPMICPSGGPGGGGGGPGGGGPGGGGPGTSPTPTRSKPTG